MPSPAKPLGGPLLIAAAMVFYGILAGCGTVEHVEQDGIPGLMLDIPVELVAKDLLKGMDRDEVFQILQGSIPCMSGWWTYYLFSGGAIVFDTQSFDTAGRLVRWQVIRSE